MVTTSNECPECGYDLETKMIDVDGTNLEELEVCELCGYGYPEGYHSKEEQDAFEQVKSLTDSGYHPDAIKAYLSHLGIEEIENFEESFMGEFESDDEFVKDLLYECGDIPDTLPFYVHIDWEATARDIMMDYFEEDGYYFRML